MITEFEYKGYKMKMMTDNEEGQRRILADTEKAVLEMKRICEAAVEDEGNYYTEGEKELAQRWLDRYYKLFG